MKVHKKAENDLKEREHWYNTKELNLSAFLNCHKALVGQLDNKTEYERYNDALKCSTTTITSTAISLPTFALRAMSAIILYSPSRFGTIACIFCSIQGQQEGFAVTDFAAVVTAKARQFRLESIYELKCDTCIGSSYFYGISTDLPKYPKAHYYKQNVCEDGLWIKHILINAEKSRKSKATFTPNCYGGTESLNQIILRDAIPKLPVNAEKSRTSKATFTPHSKDITE
ncbi:hypothetical protein RhiirC2_777888 [Rhizophagus irregularis]|uniref:Uncharacterized protein n=1 Tax=Rhizophagus irregularis TaxID=588596 RepID=A0A2N1ND78_9GLOM|nr:hypothetical protein RhiirC2_777888 [Rhizophagus irregularis]